MYFHTLIHNNILSSYTFPLDLEIILVNALEINQSMIGTYYALSIAQEKSLHLNQILKILLYSFIQC